METIELSQEQDSNAMMEIRRLMMVALQIAWKKINIAEMGSSTMEVKKNAILQENNATKIVSYTLPSELKSVAMASWILGKNVTIATLMMAMDAAALAKRKDFQLELL